MAETKAERTQQKIIEAAQSLILQNGYSATSVDDICRASEMTKGGFFYHFASKEEVGQAAMRSWSDQGSEMMSSVTATDPVERLFECIDLMLQATVNSEDTPGCVVGTISQEAGPGTPGLAAVASHCFDTAANVVEGMITAAADKLGIEPDPEDEFERIALSLQAAFQGSLVIARAKHDTHLITMVMEDFKHSLKVRFGLQQSHG